MFSGTPSVEEITKFITEILQNKLAINVYMQLLEDGGNTAFGISDNLKVKGIKASKTRVYEEIANLTRIGLIKRVSNRPPVYTTIQSPGNYEKIAMKFFMDTREDLLRRWAATYPFLPEEFKTTKSQTAKLSTGPIVNFNPYPVVDIFASDKEGLKRYMLRVFESKEVLVSNTLVDTGFSTMNFREVFEEEEFSSLFNLLKSNKEKHGKITSRVLSTYITDETKAIKKLDKLPPLYKQFFNLIDYEIRQPKEKLSSFIIGDDNLLYPVGIGGIITKTYTYIEIRDPEIVDNAKFAFEKAWENAEIFLKIENGKVSK
jgi:predicted transcriptional regulator